MGTLAYPDFKGPATKIADIDLPRIASEIGVGEDELHAFIDTETSGRGFDAEGRPKMLFEPHIFYRLLGAGAKRDAAVAAGVAYNDQGEKPYPADSYPRIEAAMKIDQGLALQSASWGMGQVLGENFGQVGFASVEDMVNAVCESEANHVQMMVDFIKTNHIDDDLRALAKLTRPTTAADCVAIVRVYNGPGYARNQYDVKFAAAHNKWRKIPDTPYAPPAEADAPAGPVIAPPAPDAVPFTIDQIKAFQADLKAKGYIEVGKADGIIGKNTLSAITAFEIAQGLPVSGQLTQSLWDAVKAAPMRPVSAERANATTQTLVQDGQPAITPAMNLQKVGAGIMATMGLGAITSGGEADLDKVVNSVGKLHALFDMISHLGPWIIGGGVGAAVLYYATHLVNGLVAEYRKGTLR